MMEIETFVLRRDQIIALLEGVLKHYKAQKQDTIPTALVLPQLARELAIICQASHLSGVDKTLKSKIARIKKLATEVLASADVASTPGVSGDMLNALIAVSNTKLYSVDQALRKGRKENNSALLVAKTFKRFYPMLTARKLGCNADHDFVRTLGQIYEILEFKVNAQHYAKRVVDGREGVGVS